VHVLTEAFGTVLLALQSGAEWGGPPWAQHGGGGFWGPWMLIPFLFWVGLLAFIAWILTRLFPRRRGRDGEAEPPRDSAEEILRERFARGEVSEGEYLRALEILRGETRPEIRDRDDHEGKMG
jgi:putative membrane protein